MAKHKIKKKVMIYIDIDILKIIDDAVADIGCGATRSGFIELACKEKIEAIKNEK